MKDILRFNPLTPNLGGIFIQMALHTAFSKYANDIGIHLLTYTYRENKKISKAA